MNLQRRIGVISLPALGMVLGALAGCGGGGGGDSTLPGAFAIGGMVSGLTGAGLVLANNGANELAVSGNGSFQFSSRLAPGTEYRVTLVSQPDGQTCSLVNAVGTAAADVTDIAVACVRNPPAALTGVFIGPVQGLRYRSASAAGYTDAGGRFSYLPGETVAFSIGGIELGTAPGAPGVSPFSLFGMAPPATEAAVRAELTTEKNVTDFDRVANIALLLAALDRDGNAANGLDLSDRDAALAGVTLSFDLPMSEFHAKRFEVFARTYAANRNVPITTPLVRLYSALGIAVPAHVMTREISHDSRNTVDRVHRLEYDSRGRQSLDVLERRAAAPPVVTRFSYDDADRRVFAGSESDLDLDGVMDSKEYRNFAYDNSGSPSTDLTENYRGVPGSLVSSVLVTSAYDARGNRTSSEQNEFIVAGARTFRTTQRSTYDAGNRRIDETTQDDHGIGTPVTYRVLQSFSYDAAGNLAQRIYQEDPDGDGARPLIAFAVAMQYDAHGNLLREESGPHGTTAPRDTFIRVFNRDPAGRLGSFDRSVFAPVVSGMPRLLKEHSTTAYTYDSNNNPLTVSTQTDYNGDGSVDDVTRTTSTYDVTGNEARRELVQVVTNGSTTVNTQVRTFDSDGVPLTFSLEFRFNGVLTQSMADQYFHATILPDGLLYLITMKGR